MKNTISLISLIAAFPAFAEDSRALDAHEHGVGTMNIAVDDTAVVIEFEAPGADIVGFEYVAERDDDLAAIDAALSLLSAPLDLFVLPAAAGCKVVDVEAELEGGEKDSDHDDHAEEEEHDHDHDDHDEETSHTEFHATYTLTCDATDELDEITFTYFDAFTNAREIEVQYIDLEGAKAFEVERDAPVLNLEP